MRRLDLAVLRGAARRLGFADESQALTAALAASSHACAGTGLVAAVIGGQPPGSLTRASVALYLGVDEMELWR